MARGGVLLGILKCICCGKPETTEITQLLISLHRYSVDSMTGSKNFIVL
ncbi:uncharacterized protein J3R85_014326 [Psidium guajava]|nr:uncharacterized protein J3R85_014326 [Psidium guajava]